MADLIFPKLNYDKIRGAIRDNKKLNDLLGNTLQFSDDDIDLVSDFAKFELSLSLRGQNKPVQEELYIFNILALLLESVSNEELRNKISYQDSNIGQIDFSNKSSEYLQMSSYYRNRLASLIATINQTSYYESAWGDHISDSYYFDYWDEV